MSREEGSIFKFMFGLISGMISGIVLGLLLAPKTGNEMRKDLKIKAKELEEIGQEKLSGLRHYSYTQAEKVASTIQEKAGKLSTKLDELAKRGSEVLIQDEVQ